MVRRKKKKKKKRMLRILKKVKEAHLKDIGYSQRTKQRLSGLCCIARNNLSLEEKDIFLKFLTEKTSKDLDMFIWDTDNKNTERLEFLNKCIEELIKL